MLSVSRKLSMISVHCEVRVYTLFTKTPVLMSHSWMGRFSCIGEGKTFPQFCGRRSINQLPPVWLWQRRRPRLQRLLRYIDRCLGGGQPAPFGAWLWCILLGVLLSFESSFYFIVVWNITCSWVFFFQDCRAVMVFDSCGFKFQRHLSRVDRVEQRAFFVLLLLCELLLPVVFFSFHEPLYFLI